MPALLEQVSEALRIRQCDLRTGIVYKHWIKRFVVFHGRRHPREMGAPEIRLFLSHLAVAEQISAATWEVALAALLFLYREVLRRPLPEIERGQIDQTKEI